MWQRHVTGRRGATVRENIETSSARVGVLAHGTKVQCYETVPSAAGVARCRVVAPLRGWVSRKCLDRGDPVLEVHPPGLDAPSFVHVVVHGQAPSKDCSFSNARLNASTGVDGAPAAGNATTPLELQFVDNRAAAHGNLTVKMFETYVAQLHGKLMGEDSGWDRFVDNHVGLYVGDYVALDAWKATLDAAGVPYMPHVAGSFTDDAPQADQVVAGSIWTAGIGGLAIELNGYFDFSEFTNASAFFFCHPT